MDTAQLILCSFLMPLGCLILPHQSCYLNHPLQQLRGKQRHSIHYHQGSFAPPHPITFLSYCLLVSSLNRFPFLIIIIKKEEHSIPTMDLGMRIAASKTHPATFISFGRHLTSHITQHRNLQHSPGYVSLEVIGIGFSEAYSQIIPKSM